MDSPFVTTCDRCRELAECPQQVKMKAGDVEVWQLWCIDCVAWKLDEAMRVRQARMQKDKSE